MNIDREEAEALVRMQLHENVRWKIHNSEEHGEAETFHYGKCEIVRLLDAIFGRDGDRIRELRSRE